MPNFSAREMGSVEKPPKEGTTEEGRLLSLLIQGDSEAFLTVLSGQAVKMHPASEGIEKAFVWIATSKLSDKLYLGIERIAGICSDELPFEPIIQHENMIAGGRGSATVGIDELDEAVETFNDPCLSWELWDGALDSELGYADKDYRRLLCKKFLLRIWRVQHPEDALPESTEGVAMVGKSSVSRGGASGRKTGLLSSPRKLKRAREESESDTGSDPVENALAKWQMHSAIELWNDFNQSPDKYYRHLQQDDDLFEALVQGILDKHWEGREVARMSREDLESAAQIARSTDATVESTMVFRVYMARVPSGTRGQIHVRSFPSLDELRRTNPSILLRGARRAEALRKAERGDFDDVPL